MSSTTIHVPLHKPVVSSGSILLSEYTEIPSREEESELLQAIRAALCGSELPADHQPSAPRSASILPSLEEQEREIIWTDDTVLLLSGGLIRRRWNFRAEEQSVQFACIGWLGRDWENGQVSATSYTLPTTPASTQKAPRATFGPFARSRQETPRILKSETPALAVFVFLRSIGKVYLLETGTEHTFSMPFVIHNAWPLTPHGVLLQRSVEPLERVEADVSGEPLLPTVFAFTDPFVEAIPIGVAPQLLGGLDGISETIIPEPDRNVRFLSSSFSVVWVSHKCPAAQSELIITVDTDSHQLAIWRYAHIQPGTTRLQRRKRTESTVEPKSSSSPAKTAATPTMHSLMKASDEDVGEIHPLDTTQLEAMSMVPRNDLSAVMDRMVLGGRLEDTPIAVDAGKMDPTFWAQKVYTQDLSVADATGLGSITATLFDDRYDGTRQRSLLAVCLPSTQTFIFSVFAEEDTLRIQPLSEIQSISITSVRSTRPNVWDLLSVKPNHSVTLYTHGLSELPISFNILGPSERISAEDAMALDHSGLSSHSPVKIASVKANFMSDVTVGLDSGHFYTAHFDLTTKHELAWLMFQVLSVSLPSETSVKIHMAFLRQWDARGLRTSDDIEFFVLSDVVVDILGLEHTQIRDLPMQASSSPWHTLSNTSCHRQFQDDPAMQLLKKPAIAKAPTDPSITKKHPLISQVLSALHILAETLRMSVNYYRHLTLLVPLVCKLAAVVRPEWADYWRRTFPDAGDDWPAPMLHDPEEFDQRLPFLAPDMLSVLFGTINNPDWNNPVQDLVKIANRANLDASFEYGRVDPFSSLNKLFKVYNALADKQVKLTHQRAENAVLLMVQLGMNAEYLNRLPLGVAAPLREALRTCQLNPPPDWPVEAYRAISREDVAASASPMSDALLTKDGYLPVKAFTNSKASRRTMQGILTEARDFVSGDADDMTGVKLDLDDFTEVRFGQDRRLQEVGRLLDSSTISTVKPPSERPDSAEQDVLKEHQVLINRVAERTLALPYGRALFTYASVPYVMREAFTVPPLEFTIRVRPLNIIVKPEAGKILAESIAWGEFHNGVAAGLRIAPTSENVAGSWVAFNKPSELTPSHAGLLFGLGLSGHLRGITSWHAFNYLLPKHDYTSIGVLLGLAAANAGNADAKITKLISVHTPALLPTPHVNMNVSLQAQAAGLSALGLLYLGTKNRRMGEVCISQFSRPDLFLGESASEYREAYTYSAAISLGMIMLGKGTQVPADIEILRRLSIYVHGDKDNTFRGGRQDFDLNLTSPASTVSLGLMYLRTGRRDVADILTIPDTVLSLNDIPPTLLLLRTISRGLIMMDSIESTSEWLAEQIPTSIKAAMDAKFKTKAHVNDAIELAYYNILAGGIFAMSLKFAGTARQDAYKLIIRYYDLYTRLVYSPGSNFDSRIRRSALRDGLNLISISLSLIMAGTGEISCFRRLRYAYGMYQQSMVHPSFKYGIHVATHISMGLLFLGGGRFTLGTSDAAIAAMFTAFFPRFHSTSSENRSYLQALRHLWVLAVEPRCLIARDVETKESVYLPLKIMMQEEGLAQLVSPTLIPDLDKIMSIKVDSPRYWPFFLDVRNVASHKDSLIKTQTIWVKRRTAFLSYTEDPRGSRSLFVRSRSTVGEAATLDSPQLTGAKPGDLSEFIDSFSNDSLFLSFADHFARPDGTTDEEQLFQVFCHAALYDSLLQGKPQTMQSHLQLFRYRFMRPLGSEKSGTQYFHLNLQDLRFASDFYSKVFDRRFSGRAENNSRLGLLRENTVAGALHTLDDRLDVIRVQPDFVQALTAYVRGESLAQHLKEYRLLAWYLLRNGMPVSTMLVILRGLARDAHTQCIGAPPPQGTTNAQALERGIKEVLHASGSKMTSALGSGWSMRSLEQVVQLWA